jgi:hypothetical protein
MRSILREDGYRVFEDGNILGVRGSILKQHKGQHGYYQVDLLSKTNLVHRIVAEAFVPNPDNKPQVNHKDGDKSNNAASNLEWCTESENSIHSFDTGLSKHGQSHFNSRLSEEDISRIREDAKNKYFGWTRDTAKRYGVSHATISRLMHSVSYKRTQTSFPVIPDHNQNL